MIVEDLAIIYLSHFPSNRFEVVYRVAKQNFSLICSIVFLNFLHESHHFIGINRFCAPYIQQSCPVGVIVRVGGVSLGSFKLE